MESAQQDESASQLRWCHQCRTKKTCVRCCQLVGKMGERRCKKSFCRSCLRLYSEDFDAAMVNFEWKCPFCQGRCTCSACSNRKTDEILEDLVDFVPGGGESQKRKADRGEIEELLQRSSDLLVQAQHKLGSHSDSISKVIRDTIQVAKTSVLSSISLLNLDNADRKRARKKPDQPAVKPETQSATSHQTSDDYYRVEPYLTLEELF
eukprot:GILJ01001926.1.p1 GENE.GILJ01001926.1~~GILJ01001926.1.p1  ORF type:complete len:207 (+),score=9.57 GILJ01001926.1:128-748(+)